MCMYPLYSSHPAGKAFFDVHGVASLEFIDVLDGIRWIDQHFHLILPPVDEMPSIDYILEKARAAVLRYGVLCWAWKGVLGRQRWADQGCPVMLIECAVQSQHWQQEWRQQHWQQ